MKSDNRIRELEELIVRLIAEKEIAIAERNAALERARELEKEYLELKNKLAYYEGPHVPPSVETIKKKEEKKPSGKKRGAPKGHRGATRKTPPPERVVDVKAVQCPECHQHPGGSVGTETSIVEDIIPPPGAPGQSHPVRPAQVQVPALRPRVHHGPRGLPEGGHLRAEPAGVHHHAQVPPEGPHQEGAGVPAP